jgi:RHS repeat-associated protein
VVQYVYDASGNHTRRTLISGAHAEYDIDELNRVRGQSDYFASGQMGRFDYAFDAMGRHRYEQRDWGTADGYQFDPRDQLTGYQRDGDLNMDGSVSAAFWNNTGLHYDNNGNRTQVTGNGAATYSVNSLNQYGNVSNLGDLGYDPKGNLTSAAGWTYGYDAQNRLTTMQGPGMTITQTYDPLNRVITRNVNGAVTQNVWEGWNLIEEHRPDWSIQRCYLQGANQNEMVVAFDGGVYTKEWFWQDGRGNTSHITGDNAYLLERYTYDLSGAPKFYDEWGNERWGGSVYDTRFLFAGSQYLPETGLYDMRNRFYSPTLNRFLQTDPIGFAGDALNLYRYCGDDPVDRTDPMGLLDDNDIGSHSSLTSFDHGDWVKGSDGLSDWDRDKRQPAGNVSFGLVDANKNDNGKFYGAVESVEKARGISGVSTADVGHVLVNDAHDAAQEEADHLRLGNHQDSGDERAYARYVHGTSLTRDGKQPVIGHNNFSGSETGLPGFHKSGPAPLTGSHSHGPQQGPFGRQFQRQDISSADGHNIANARYISSVGWYRDPHGMVNIYVPGGGAFHSSDGENFYSGQFIR